MSQFESVSPPLGPQRRAVIPGTLAARPSRAPAADKVDRALAAIDARLGEKWSLDALAAAASLSRFHFARAFRRMAGCSPMEYVARTRIERAKLLLGRGDISICEIAALLGFCDQSHFTRVFRRLTGVAPGQFVRRVRCRGDDM